jgi:hypothetical protein
VLDTWAEEKPWEEAAGAAATKASS